MSGTMITLQFSAVVDTDHLPGYTSTDDVENNLRAAMARSGQAYIDQHPELFRSGTGLV